MKDKLSIKNLTTFINNYYLCNNLDNTDFVVDLHIKFKTLLGIKSVVKQGFLYGKAIVYLQLKTKSNIIYIYYNNNAGKIIMVNKENSDISDKY